MTTTQTTLHRPGSFLRINTTDVGVVIEVRSGNGWTVPAWEAEGFPMLAGPFASIEDAEWELVHRDD